MNLTPCQHRRAKINYNFGRLSQARLNEILSDGRVVSHLLFPFFAARFANLQPLCSDTGAYRYKDGHDNTLQLRTVGAKGQTNPHRQNGVKRKYDRDEHTKMLDEITHFLFVYIGKMPRIEFAVLPKFVIENQPGTPQRSITADEALLWIRQAPLFADI